MTSLATHRSFECAPHATRSIAIALSLSLNLTVLLFALRPSTPFVIQALPPRVFLASVLQPLRPVPPPPVVPIPHAVQHVTTPSISVVSSHPTPIAVSALPSIVPVAPVPVTRTAPASGSNVPAAAGTTNATIAYATASPPVYPIQALRAGVQGTVLLKVLVDSSGKPVRVTIAHSSGSHVLDEAARRHVLAAWRFHPATRDGHAIEAWALVPVRFDLNRM